MDSDTYKNNAPTLVAVLPAYLYAPGTSIMFCGSDITRYVTEIQIRADSKERVAHVTISVVANVEITIEDGTVTISRPD